MAKKTGRPPKRDKARERLVGIRLADDEYELLERLAHAKGSASISEFIRDELLETISQARASRIEGHSQKRALQPVFTLLAEAVDNSIYMEDFQPRLFEVVDGTT